MSAKMRIAELKEKLYTLNYDELIELIVQLYQSSPQAVNILCTKFGNNEYGQEMMEECRKKIRKQFFTEKGGIGKLSLADAKKAISDFKKLKPPAEHILELQIYYIECCTELTRTYGDMYESFYNSLESMFYTVIKGLKKENSPELYDRYYPRLEKLLDNLEPVGYVASYDMRDTLEELNWPPEQENE